MRKEGCEMIVYPGAFNTVTGPVTLPSPAHRQAGVRSNRKPGGQLDQVSVVRDSEGHSVIFMVI